MTAAASRYSRGMKLAKKPTMKKPEPSSSETAYEIPRASTVDVREPSGREVSVLWFWTTPSGRQGTLELSVGSARESVQGLIHITVSSHHGTHRGHVYMPEPSIPLVRSINVGIIDIADFHREASRLNSTYRRALIESRYAEAKRLNL